MLSNPVFLFLLLALPTTALLAQGADSAVKPSDRETDWLPIITAVAGLLTAAAALYVSIVTAPKAVEKLVDEQVKAKAKTYVDEFFAKELHIDPNTARSFFETYQKDLDTFAAKRLFVIYHPDDPDQQTLVAQLMKAGFKQAKSRTTTDSLSIEANDILLFDATQGLDNPAIDQYAINNNLAAKAQFFYFGPSRYEGKLKMTNFANSQASIVNRIKEASLA